MKNVGNIVVTTVLCIICSTISMYAAENVPVQETGNGTVNVKVVNQLFIDVNPAKPFPLGVSREKIGQGDERVYLPEDMLFITYTICSAEDTYADGTGQGMDITITHNGNGVGGNGVDFVTKWFWYPDFGFKSINKRPLVTGDNLKLDNTYGQAYVRCYIEKITAEDWATPGNHQVTLTLTAAYKY